MDEKNILNVVTDEQLTEISATHAKIQNVKLNMLFKVVYDHLALDYYGKDLIVSDNGEIATILKYIAPEKYALKLEEKKQAAAGDKNKEV